MAGLAQYAAGGTLPMLAKGMLTNASSVAATLAASNAASQSNGVLTAEFNIVASNYLAQSADTFSNALTKADGLNASITNTYSWTSWFTDTNASSIQAKATLISIQSNAWAAVTLALTNASITMTNINFVAATNGVSAVNFAAIYNLQTVNILSAVGKYKSSISIQIERDPTLTNSITSMTNLPDFLKNLSNSVTDYQTDTVGRQTKAMNDCEAGLNLISHILTGN
jgi:hypothetical protein